MTIYVDTTVAFLSAKEYIMTADDIYMFDAIVNHIITTGDIAEVNSFITHNQQLMEESTLVLQDTTINIPKYCEHRETYNNAKYICDGLMKFVKSNGRCLN